MTGKRHYFLLAITLALAGGGAITSGCMQQAAKEALAVPTPSPTPSATPVPLPPAVKAAPVAAAGPPGPSAKPVPVGNGKMLKTASGLQYEDEVIGKGAAAKTGQFASVQYTGTLTDGTKFDSSYDHGGTPFSFQLGAHSVIKGWDEGVVGMKPGGKRKLVIPPDLAYGSGGQGSIPPNSTLIFTVELISVSDQSTAP